MALVCPNKNTQEWKDLVKEYGEVKAMSAFVMNNENIPSVKKASELFSKKITDTFVQEAGALSTIAPKEIENLQRTIEHQLMVEQDDELFGKGGQSYVYLNDKDARRFSYILNKTKEFPEEFKVTKRITRYERKGIKYTPYIDYVDFYYVKSNKNKKSNLYNIVNRDTGELLSSKVRVLHLSEDRKSKIAEEYGLEFKPTKVFSSSRSISFALYRQKPSKAKYIAQAKRYLYDAIKFLNPEETNLEINLDKIEKLLDAFPEEMWDYINTTYSPENSTNINASSRIQDNIRFDLPKLGLLQEIEKLTGIELQGVSFRNYDRGGYLNKVFKYSKIPVEWGSLITINYKEMTAKELRAAISYYLKQKNYFKKTSAVENVRKYAEHNNIDYTELAELVFGNIEKALGNISHNYTGNSDTMELSKWREDIRTYDWQAIELFSKPYENFQKQVKDKIIEKFKDKNLSNGISHLDYFFSGEFNWVNINFNNISGQYYLSDMETEATVGIHAKPVGFVNPFQMVTYIKPKANEHFLKEKEVFNRLAAILHEPFHALHALSYGTEEEIELRGAFYRLYKTKFGREMLEQVFSSGYNQKEQVSYETAYKEFTAFATQLMLYPKEWIKKTDLRSNDIYDFIEKIQTLQDKTYTETEKIYGKIGEIEVEEQIKLNFLQKLYNYIIRALNEIIPLSEKFFSLISDTRIITENVFGETTREITKTIKLPEEVKRHKADFINAMDELKSAINTLMQIDSKLFSSDNINEFFSSESYKQESKTTTQEQKTIKETDESTKSQVLDLTALEDVVEMYAEGEITKKEFDRIKQAVYKGEKVNLKERPPVEPPDYFSGRETLTSVEFLESIQEGDVDSDLAKKLLPHARKHNVTIHKEDNSKRLIGVYTSTLWATRDKSEEIDRIAHDKILIDTKSRLFKNNPKRVLLHEIVHSLTSIYVNEYVKQQGPNNGIKVYMDYVLDHFNFKELPYAFTDELEFVSESLTNKSLIKLLQQVPPKNTNRFKSLFHEILDFITKLFGIKEYSNTYEQFTDLVEGIMLLQDEMDVYAEERTQEHVKRTLQKYEILRRFVPFGVKIKFDRSMEDDAKYEPKEKTIYINPLSLSEESIGHEFGHILLLLMNGMRNPLIQKAREQLNNWDKVPSILEEYQDRYDTQEKLDLEVVAQALGKEVTALVEKELNRNTLERLFARIYEWFRSRLGLERNAVKKLANMMLEGKVITDTLEARNIKDVIPLSESTAYMALFKRRAKAKEKNVFEKYDITDGVVDETSLQAFTENAIEVIERKIKLYKSKSKNVPIEKAREYLERVKEANDAEESLYNFIELAYQSTLDIYKDYTLKKHNNNITISTLDSWKDYIGGFGLVDKMYYALRREFEEAYKLTEEGKTSAESKSRKSIYTDKAFEYMRKTIDMKQEIENAYVVEGSRLLADFLAPYHKHVEIELRDYIEKEYYALSKEEKAKISFEDYMEREFGLKEEWLAKATRSSIYKEILQASGDIGTIGRWIDTIIDSKDALVSAMIKVFTEKDAKAHREYTALRYDLIDLVRELENFYSNKYTALTDVRQMYDYMLEKDEYGRYTGYLLTEVKGGFEEQFRRDLEAYKEEESNPDKIEAFVRAWFKENATMDWKAYKKDFFGYIDSLNIPEEELRRYKNALSIKEYQKKGMLVYSTEEVVPESFIKNLETVEKIKEWESRNRKKYRIYADKWKNKDFDKLRNILRNPEDPRTKFYNFIVENTERLQFNLPPSQSIGLRIPAVMKDTAEYAAEGKVKKGLKRKVERTLGVTFEDEETRGTEAPGVADEERGTSRTRLTDELGNPVDFIPILYSRPVTDENGMLREDISLDLGTAFLRYFRMAIEYGYKKEILPELELTKFFLSNRKYIELDAEGRPYIDALDPKKKRLSTKEGSASKIAEMYSDWLEMVIYGKQKKDEGVIPLVNIDFAKGMDVLTQYTAINMLGLNVIQGVANAILGHANDWIEAFGGEHYTVKDFARADVVYMKHLAQTLGDIGQRKPESLVNLLNDQFDTLHEFDGDKVKDNNLFKTLFRVDTMFATSQMGEHMIQSKVMLAMLNNKKAYDVNGKEMGTILDIYKVNPKTKRLEYVEGFSEEKSKWTEKDQLDFQMTLGRIMADLHGDYYQKAKPAFHAYALGRMAGLFRKFIVPGFKRRWSKRHPDTLRGRMVEGYYLSFGRFAGRLLKDLVRFKFQVMSEDWSKITPSEKANIRRGAAEMAFLLATVILITAFTKIEGDDDDDEFERWVYNFARYQSYRFKAEISFFYNPSETLNILRSPAATVGMIQSSIQLLSQLIDPVDGPFERYESGSWEGHMKIEKHATNLFAPGYKQWYRLKYVDDFVTWFK